MTHTHHVRRRRRIRRRPSAPLVLICVCMCLGVALLEKALQSPRGSSIIHTVPDSFDFGKYKISVPREAAAKRTVYPYSVISGGIADRDELAAAAASDPLVAAHYADFDVERANIVRALDTKLVHVSYRIQNKVYWTAQKIPLVRGEKLITDGKNLARTRCGNRVSAVPQQPTSAEEPPPDVFDTPFIPVDPLPLIETISVPSLKFPEFPLPFNPPDLLTFENLVFDSSLVPQIPSPYFPPLYLLEEFPETPEFPGEVPEPGTLILMGSGLAISILLKRFGRRRKGSLQ